MTKTTAFILGILFAGTVCAGFSFYQQHEYKKDKKIWQAQMSEREKAEMAAKAEADKYLKLANDNLVSANEWHLKADEFHRLWQDALGKADYWREQAETIPPDEVVSQTAFYIPVAITEIKLMAKGTIEFTLVAARANLNNLYQYKAVLIPAFEGIKKENNSLRSEIGDLRLVDTNFKLAKIEWDKERGGLIADKESYKEQLAKCERRIMPKFSLGLNVPTVAVGVGGFVLGVVVYSFVHK